MSISSKIREALKNRNEVANKNEVEFTSSDDGYIQWRQVVQQAVQPYMTYTKAAIAQGNQSAMQVLMDNPGAWMLYAANVRQDAYDPLGAMDVEMSIKFLDPAVCRQFYGVSSGVIQSQPVGMPAWNPSLTITVPRPGDEGDEDDDNYGGTEFEIPGFSFEEKETKETKGKYVTSFKEAM